METQQEPNSRRDQLIKLAESIKARHEVAPENERLAREMFMKTFIEYYRSLVPVIEVMKEMKLIFNHPTARTIDKVVTSHDGPIIARSSRDQFYILSGERAFRIFSDTGYIDNSAESVALEDIASISGFSCSYAYNGLNTLVEDLESAIASEEKETNALNQLIESMKA